MKFTVIWLEVAEEEYIRLWLDAPDRSQVTNAANLLDAAMQLNPDAVGESREANERIAFTGPLVVGFTIDKGDRTVRVFRIRRIDGPRKDI